MEIGKSCLTKVLRMSRSHVLSGWRGNRGGVPWKAARSRTTRRLRLEPLEDRRLLAVFTITNLDDGPVNAPHDLPGSLRQAIYDANANPGADQIVWQDGLTGTITLTDGELLITDDVTVTGLGDAQTTVDAAGNSRVFNIDDGAASLLTVQIEAMTITGGSAADYGGGGIRRRNGDRSSY